MHLALGRAWREHWARLVGLVLGQYARPDLAEDAVAEAFAAAARTWPVDGVPANPPAWLLTTARRRVVDVLRAEAVHRRKQPLMAVDARTRAEAASALDPGEHISDDALRLLFTCCHPALAPEARVALTLRFVMGLEVPDIARLLLVQDATLAARLTRAKKRLAASGIPFAVPPPERLEERLDVVATVVYLVFTAGYQPGPRDRALRTDLGSEAIRLARVMDRLLPGRPVVRALLALMLLQHSRRDARLDEDGRLVLLPEQDRSRWHDDEIRAGLELLRTVPPGEGLAEEYRLQALIAAEHATAADPAATRWPVVAEHYAALELLTGSPVVRLARAVAVAEADGPRAGLALLEGLDEEIPRSHRLAAVRGELLARAGRRAEAVVALERAIALASSPVEVEHLRERLEAARR
ncbi:RNA polymerase subunit sigma-24 [Actinotalea sp. K2]|nr:RNA polymerase subunit sigma-24 [Actinotalea sp. K2]